MEVTAEALGYAILMLAVFDMNVKKRSQLQLLLETMFFGFKTPEMVPQTAFTVQELTNLIKQSKGKFCSKPVTFYM